MSAAITPGAYRCRAVAGSEEWIQVGDGQVLSIELRLTRVGQDVGTMRTRLKFNDPKAVKYTGLKLRALGVRGDDLFALEGLGDREADVEVELVSWNGREFLSANVKHASATTPLDATSRAALRERLNAVAAEVPELPPEEEFTTDEALPF